MTRDAWIASVAEGQPGTTPEVDSALIDAMVAAGMDAIRRDLAAAKRLGAMALRLAKRFGDARSIGLSERLLGHVQLLRGNSAKAIPHYHRAREHFSSFPADHAATATAMLQALAYVGDFEQAFTVAEQAQAYFLGDGDVVRAARIEANKANALHRLDRLQEARAAYERALDVLREQGTAADVAIVMRNFAVTLMGLLELDAADHMYAETRQRFEAEAQTALVLEVDLNRAYLLGRKGRIREALVAYRGLQRRLSEELSELSFEAGHSLLDQADLMLEFGLWTDAQAAASQASALFKSLGLKFELGKAKLVEALASIRTRQNEAAKQRLKEAARLLRNVPNPVWEALSLRAQAEFELLNGHPEGAIAALHRAESLLADSIGLERKEVLAQDLSALMLSQGHIDAVAKRLLSADPQRAETMALRARVAHTAGDPDAPALMRAALAKLDERRASLGPSLLRQASAQAHEALLRAALDLFESPQDRFEVVRRLKHQALAELVESPEAMAPDGEIRRLREQLFALQSVSADEARDRTEERAKLESEVLMRLREAAMTAGQTDVRLDAKPVVPLGTRLVELFIHGDTLFATLMDPGRTQEVCLGPLSAIERDLRLLRMGIGRAFRDPRASSDHLLDSLGETFGPLWDAPSETVRWVIGREPRLASLPFHALRIEGHFAYERGDCVVAPTVSAWSALRARPSDGGVGVAVVGSADERAPEIAAEAEAIAELLGAPTFSINEQLSPEEIAERIQSARVVHLAAHGIHREDRPLLSSLRLGGGEWSVFDLSHLRLKADLVSLSGCSTGRASAGSELDAQGFIEALLVAGARCVLASVWDVDDKATRHWMAAFFAAMREGHSVGAAFRTALDAVRAEYPHPAFWAAFALFGAPHENPVPIEPMTAHRTM